MIERRIAAVLGLAGVGVLFSCASPEEVGEAPSSAAGKAVVDAPVDSVLAAPEQDPPPVAPDEDREPAPVAAPPSPAAGAGPSLPAGVPLDGPAGTALVVEPRTEGWTVAALVERASEASGVRIALNVSDPLVQRARAQTIGRDAVPAGEVLPWLQSVLHAWKLTLVPHTEPGVPWTVAAGDRWGQTEDRPGHPTPRPVEVAPDVLEQLERREGLFVTTTFPLAAGVDAARTQQAIGALSTWRLGRIVTTGSPPALTCSDFAPTLAAMWRLLGQAGLLAAEAVPAPSAAERLEAREHVVLVMPQPAGPVTVTDLLDWVAEGADASFYFDPRSRTIRDGSVEFVGETHIWRRRAIPWLRSVLLQHKLVVLPLGQAGPHGQARWSIVDLANPVVRSQATVVAEEEVEDLARFGGEFVATVLQLPAGSDPLRIRNALAQTSTVIAGLGSVTQVPGRNALVVRDFAPTVAAMRKVLRGGDPGVAPAAPGPEASRVPTGSADADLVVLPDPEGLRGYSATELLYWASEAAELTFQFDPRDRLLQSAEVRLAGDQALPRADVLPWLGTMLRFNKLALVPLQTDDGRPGAHAPNRYRHWSVVGAHNEYARMAPLHAPGLTPASVRVLPDPFVVAAPRLAESVDGAAVRRAFSHLRTRTAAIGRVVDIPGSGRLLVGDSAQCAVRIADALGLAGLLAEEPGRGSRLDAFVARDVQTGRRVGVSRESWRLEQLLPSVATSTGHRFLWSFGPRSPRKNVAVEFESPKQTAPAHEVLRRLQNALLEHKLVMVPLLAPRKGRIGAMWGVVDQADPTVASHALPVSAAEVPGLARWNALYITTALRLKPGVDTQALRKQVARRSTQFAGLGSVHELADRSLLVVTDFASVVAKIRSDLVREDVLR